GRLWFGLVLLGFTSLYREGFEVVLFLQSYYLRLGGGVVLKGALLGIVLTGLVAILTFVLQQRLPYRKMLITTGILLGMVLLVMVGEQAQEMQLAHWIATTQSDRLANVVRRTSHGRTARRPINCRSPGSRIILRGSTLWRSVARKQRASRGSTGR